MCLEEPINSEPQPMFFFFSQICVQSYSCSLSPRLGIMILSNARAPLRAHHDLLIAPVGFAASMPCCARRVLVHRRVFACWVIFAPSRPTHPPAGPRWHHKTYCMHEKLATIFAKNSRTFWDQTPSPIMEEEVFSTDNDGNNNGNGRASQGSGRHR